MKSRHEEVMNDPAPARYLEGVPKNRDKYPYKGEREDFGWGGDERLFGE
jgi:hypothetical protein